MLNLTPTDHPSASYSKSEIEVILTRIGSAPLPVSHSSIQGGPIKHQQKLWQYMGDAGAPTNRYAGNIRRGGGGRGRGGRHDYMQASSSHPYPGRRMPSATGSRAGPLPSTFPSRSSPPGNWRAPRNSDDPRVHQEMHSQDNRGLLISPETQWPSLRNDDDTDNSVEVNGKVKLSETGDSLESPIVIE